MPLFGTYLYLRHLTGHDDLEPKFRASSTLHSFQAYRIRNQVKVTSMCGWSPGYGISVSNIGMRMGSQVRGNGFWQ